MEVVVDESVPISVSSSELERCTLVTFGWEFIICNCKGVDDRGKCCCPTSHVGRVLSGWAIELLSRRIS